MGGSAVSLEASPDSPYGLKDTRYLAGSMPVISPWMRIPLQGQSHQKIPVYLGTSPHHLSAGRLACRKHSIMQALRRASTKISHGKSSQTSCSM